MKLFYQRPFTQKFTLSIFSGILMMISSSVFSVESSQLDPSIKIQTIEKQTIEKKVDQEQIPQQSFPINFYSDTTTMDGITREIKNCGNARINQGDINLLADCLVAQKGEKGEYEFFKATGNPASVEIFDPIKKEYLFLSAKNIFYDVVKQRFIATESANLILSSGKNTKDSEDRLNIQSHEILIKNASVKNRMIEAKGLPVNLSIHSEGNIELNAKSHYLSYSTKTNELNLLDNVEAELALGKITAGEFRYNHRTKQSSFKKSDGEQIKIEQNQKSETP